MQSVCVSGNSSNDRSERVAAQSRHRIVVAKEAVCLMKERQIVGRDSVNSESSGVLGRHAGCLAVIGALSATGVAAYTGCDGGVLIHFPLTTPASAPGTDLSSIDSAAGAS